jgi:hypothetical protein
MYVKSPPFQSPFVVCKRRNLGIDVLLLVSSDMGEDVKSPEMAYVISKYIRDIIRHCSVHFQWLSNNIRLPR